MGHTAKRSNISEKVGMSDPPNRQDAPPTGGFSAAGGPVAGGAALGVFAKHWTPGMTKTRLAASIGPERAAAVSRAFVETTLDRLAWLVDGVSERTVVFTPAAHAASFTSLTAIGTGSWRATPQGDGDLGERMRGYFIDALGQSPCALLVGSDSPHLPVEAVAAAIGWLNEPDADRRLVLGPSEDGGYWLIGVRGELPPVFDRMPWSNERLLEQTLLRLGEAGWREGRDYRLVDPWYDVDEADDLKRMRRELRGEDDALNRLADRLDELLGSNDDP
ncbi:hypothetical protein MalM25_23460 [Planctomycetes bacterium MalM25]|nr:hypothetical protein MalM25_23460 [Planctomycetes bacterium MalM25]